MCEFFFGIWSCSERKGGWMVTEVDERDGKGILRDVEDRKVEFLVGKIFRC